MVAHHRRRHPGADRDRACRDGHPAAHRHANSATAGARQTTHRAPEYARVARARFLALIITATLLAILFLAAIITAGRPTGFSSATRNFETLHPEDIMICVGEPVTDAATAGLLNYFTQQMKTFTTQRIGLTSPTLRVVPLTRNYDWAAQQFTAYANLSALQRDIDAGKKLGDHEVSELSNGITSFSRSINYTDYVRSVDDILALCMTGFPGFEDKSGHRRSLIYMGYSKIRADDDPAARCTPPRQSKTWPHAPAFKSTPSRAATCSADPSSLLSRCRRSWRPPAADSACTTLPAPEPIPAAPTPPCPLC